MTHFGNAEVKAAGRTTSALTPGTIPQFVIPCRQKKVVVAKTKSDAAVDSDGEIDSDGNDTCTSYNIISGSQPRVDC